MKMHDIGEENQEPCGIGGKPKKEKHYPTTYLSSKKLPDIGEYDVDDEVELHSICRVIGKRINKDKSIEVTVETHSCGIMPASDTKKRMEMGVDKETYGKMKEKRMV